MITLTDTFVAVFDLYAVSCGETVAWLRSGTKVRARVLVLDSLG